MAHLSDLQDFDLDKKILSCLNALLKAKTLLHE